MFRWKVCVLRAVHRRTTTTHISPLRSLVEAEWASFGRNWRCRLNDACSMTRSERGWVRANQLGTLYIETPDLRESTSSSEFISTTGNTKHMWLLGSSQPCVSPRCCPSRTPERSAYMALRAQCSSSKVSAAVIRSNVRWQQY